jgi:hypothetical protein
MALRQVAVYTLTATTQACLANCIGDDDHKGAWCQHSQCLHQQRMEDKDIGDMGNFEGEAFMPAGSGTWYVEVSYNGADGADDLTYDLLVDVRSAADEHPQSSPAVVNVGSDGTGVVGWGHGMLGPGASNGLGRVARGILDYDAEFAHEWFQFNFPAGGGDQALTIQWTILPGPGMSAGQRSYDLGLHFIFCADSGCGTKLDVPGGGVQNVFGYDSSPYDPWYYGNSAFADAGLPGMQKAFDPFNSSTGVFKLAAVQCACIDAAHAASGKFFVVAEPINRTSYADSPIKLQFSLSSYPPTVTDDSGKSFACPVPCGWLAFYQ